MKTLHKRSLLLWHRFVNNLRGTHFWQDNFGRGTRHFMRGSG
jgi:hypothetical protein